MEGSVGTPDERAGAKPDGNAVSALAHRRTLRRRGGVAVLSGKGAEKGLSQVKLRRSPIERRQDVVQLACRLLQEGLAEAGGVASWRELVDLVEQPPAVLAFLDVTNHELGCWCSLFDHDVRPIN
jgi:hypothetical protein